MFSNKTSVLKISIIPLIITVISFFCGIFSTSGILSTPVAIIISAVLFLASAFLLTLFFIKPINIITKQTKNLTKDSSGKRINAYKNGTYAGLVKNINSLADAADDKALVAVENIANGEFEGDAITQDSYEKIKVSLENIESTIDSAANGNFDAHCDLDELNGVFKELGEKLNNLCDSIKAPTDEINGLISKIASFDYSSRIKGHYSGAFGTLAEKVNNTVDTHAELQDTLEAIANGDNVSLDEYEVKGNACENDIVSPSITKIMQNINAVEKECDNFKTACENGEILTYKSQHDDKAGIFKNIEDDINDAAAAIAKPLDEALCVLNSFHAHRFDHKCEGDYNGCFNELEIQINTMSDNFAGLIGIAEKISLGDVSVLNQLEMMHQGNENDTIINVFIRMIESIVTVIDEMENISKAAIEGNLNYRSENHELSGIYIEAIDSLNKMFDAIATPVNELATNLYDMTSVGSLNFVVTYDYKGQFKTLKESIESAISGIKNVIMLVVNIVVKMSSGDLSSDHIRDLPGDYKVLPEAFNKVLDSLNALLVKVKDTSD